jgi:hypothetical protein
MMAVVITIQADHHTMPVVVIVEGDVIQAVGAAAIKTTYVGPQSKDLGHSSQMEQHIMVKPNTFPVWVAVQEIERRYGGPEEGGWWYDAEIKYLDLIKIEDERSWNEYAADACDIYKLKSPFGDTLPYRGNGSVSLSLWFGQDRPQDVSRGKPQYE